MDSINYETGEVITTYVYRESSSNHDGIMIWFIALMIIIVIMFFLIGRMVGEKLKNKKK